MGYSRLPIASLVTMGNNNGTPVLREEDILALTQTSGLDRTEIENTFNEFVDEHPTGNLTRKDFKKIMTLALPAKDANKMEKHCFRIYDENNDGYISFVEFMMILHIMSEGTPEDVLGKVFRVFDVNSDGRINKQEMERLVKDMYGLIKAENPQAESEALIAESVFTEMDTDGDGMITMEEFIRACLAREELSKMLATKVMDIFIDDE